jgi:uncharacterized protein
VWETVLVLLSGVAAGALNAVGGGGTFVALPALVAFGLPPVTANALSRIALVPGAATSAWVLRRDRRPVGGTSTRALTVTSVLGGAVGAALLLVLPASSFDVLAPWLLAFATVVLAFGRRLTRAVGRTLDMGPRAVLVSQFVLAVYGGYFGGAVGIMMLATWHIGLGQDPATGNPMRVTQLAAIFLSATVLFLIASDALRTPAILTAMLIGAVLGGFVGAHVARKVPPRALRATILTIATAMTVLYFVQS